MGGGRRLGSHYELGGTIGRGGMGEVWRAVDLTDGTPVAVKVLKPEFASDRKLLARFVQERDILVSLRHPNLVRVRDLVVDGDDIAIVMDLVEGGDLRQALAAHGGTLPAAAALTIVAQLFDALHVVHGAGIVHRDVKPENVLLPGGDLVTAQLSDFGIARVTGERAVSTTHTSLIGTPYYMAPEMADGRTVTAATDVYAVGCTLYELLAGTVPFTGATMVVLRRHADEAPLPIPGVPADLSHFLDACLAKDPSHRPTAAQAAEACRVLARRHGALAALPRLAPPPARVGAPLPPSGPWAGVLGATPAPVATPDGATGPVAPGPWYRRAAIVVPAALLALVALTAGLVGALGRDDREAPVAPVRYATAPFVFDAAGNFVTTTWTLGGGSPRALRAEVTVTNPGATAARGSVDVLVPKSMLASLTAAEFVDAPASIDIEDHVLTYAFDALAPRGSATFRYSLRTTGSDTKAEDRLTRWGDELSAWMAARYQGIAQPPKLTALRFSSPDVQLVAGLEGAVSFSGLLEDGADLPEERAARVVFSSTDESVARVERGATTRQLRIVTGAAGTVTITARSGDVTATLTVTVAGAPVVEAAAAPTVAPAGAAPSGLRTPSPTGGARPTADPGPGGAVQSDERTAAATGATGTPGGTPAPPPPVVPVAPTSTTTSTTSTTTSTVVPSTPQPPVTPQPPAPAPCSWDVGGSGRYPAELAQISGPGAQVNCENAGFAGTGYIGNWDAGTSVTFTVDVPSSGRYNVVFRFNNGGGTATRSVLTSAGGSAVARFTNTTWGNPVWNPGQWNRAVVNVWMSGGRNTIRLTGGAGYVDLDEISTIDRTGGTFTASLGGGVRTAAYQAENAERSGVHIGTVADNPGYAGSGYLGNFGWVGNRVTFHGVAAASGVSFRYRCPGYEGPAQRLISVNGASVLLVDLPCSGGDWSDAPWSEVHLQVPVPPGASVSVDFIGTDGSGFIDLDQMTAG